MIKTVFYDIYTFAYSEISYQVLLLLAFIIIVNLSFDTCKLIKNRSWTVKAWSFTLLRKFTSFIFIGLSRGLDLSFYELTHVLFVQYVVVVAYFSQEIRILAIHFEPIRGLENISYSLQRASRFVDFYLERFVDVVLFLFKPSNK